LTAIQRAIGANGANGANATGNAIATATAIYNNIMEISKKKYDEDIGKKKVSGGKKNKRRTARRTNRNNRRVRYTRKR
jgi:hypothetical protein